MNAEVLRTGVIISLSKRKEASDLFISNFNQALDIVFSTNGKLNVMLWRRRIGAAIGTIELELIRSFVLQFGSWLWSNGMER